MVDRKFLRDESFQGGNSEIGRAKEDKVHRAKERVKAEECSVKGKV
jgi:hypothetical protein